MRHRFLIGMCAFLCAWLQACNSHSGTKPDTPDTPTHSSSSQSGASSSTSSSGAQTAHVEIYIRKNLFGYSPKRKKQIIVLATEDLTSQPFRVTSLSDASDILIGTLLSSVVGAGTYTPFSFNYTIDVSTIKTPGQYRIEIGQKTHPLAESVFTVSLDPLDKKTSINEALTHLRVARSGDPNALHHSASHTGDADIAIMREAEQDTIPDDYTGGLSETHQLYTTDLRYIWRYFPDQRIDIKGGWYDAGDYIKFTLTNALTTYFLLHAYSLSPELFEDQFSLSQTTLNNGLDAAKFGLDYLMKLMPDSNTFITQVGSQEDHNVGFRLPQNDSLAGIYRPAFSALVPQTMALVSAALAKGSVLFQSHDAELAKSYKQQAINLFERASADDTLTYYPYDQAWFYPDHSYHDNMALAAIELYYATQEFRYFDTTQVHLTSIGTPTFASWGDHGLMSHLRLLNSTSHTNVEAETRLDTSLKTFLNFSKRQVDNSTTDDNNLWGRAVGPLWASLYNNIYVGAMAFERATQGDVQFAELGYSILDYTFGRNNWGLSFFATERVSPVAHNTYSQIYTLQPALFPLGALSEGPVDRDTLENHLPFMHNVNEILDDITQSPFNTSAEVFNDNSGNYATMETTIFGQAIFIYMISALHAYETESL